MDDNPYSAPQTHPAETPTMYEWQQQPLSLVALAFLVYVVLPAVIWLVCFLASLLYEW